MTERQEKWYPCKEDRYGHLKVNDNDRNLIYVTVCIFNGTTSEMDDYSISLSPGNARTVANELLKRADALERK